MVFFTYCTVLRIMIGATGTRVPGTGYTGPVAVHIAIQYPGTLTLTVLVITYVDYMIFTVSMIYIITHKRL